MFDDLEIPDLSADGDPSEQIAELEDRPRYATGGYVESAATPPSWSSGCTIPPAVTAEQMRADLELLRQGVPAEVEAAVLDPHHRAARECTDEEQQAIAERRASLLAELRRRNDAYRARRAEQAGQLDFGAA